MTFIIMRNMEKIISVLLFCLILNASGSLSMTDEERASMPVMHHLDRFSKCVDKKGGVYCTTYATLFANGPNKLLDMMDAYRHSSKRHFNYSNIIYGICVTDRCKKFYRGNTTSELHQSVEDCLNDKFSREYGLQARIRKFNCYHNKEEKYKTDSLDWIVLYGVLGLISLCLLATIYDVAFGMEKEEGLLLSFSLRANWNRLAAPPTNHPRLSKLQGLSGIRVMTTVMVMLGHAPVAAFYTIENPQWLEYAFVNPAIQTFLQGHVITLTFFVLSGFLLTYNLQVYLETHKMHWSLLPKGILIRWLRLTPVNLLIIALSTTWVRFYPYGPFWHEHIAWEADDCRRYWWANLFYLNNYMDYSNCNVQTWSMAADMHLQIIALALIVFSPTVKARNRALLIFFVIGLILPGIETYVRNLDATLLVVAEMIREYFLADPTFNNTYKRSHTNIPCFVIGMATGYIAYDWKENTYPEKYRKLMTYAYWTLFPLMLYLPLLTYMMFLGDEPYTSMYIKVLYAIFQKPLFGILVAMVFIGVITKLETTPLYSRILGWPLWTPLSRMTYSMFGVHAMVARYLGCMNTTLTFLTFTHLIHEFAGLVVQSTILGFLVYMFVEAPFGQVVKYVLSGKLKSQNREEDKAIGQRNVSNGKSSYTNGHSYANGKSNGVYTNGKSLKAE